MPINDAVAGPEKEMTATQKHAHEVAANVKRNNRKIYLNLTRTIAGPQERAEIDAELKKLWEEVG